MISENLEIIVGDFLGDNYGLLILTAVFVILILIVIRGLHK